MSGGGDSVALLDLAQRWAAARATPLHVATVDHGLRPAAAAEATAVARLAAACGLPHAVLHWDGSAARGNLQDAARRARYRLLAGWAQGRGLAAVALGHTLDDQAETVLLRLARGSGVDGLAGMAVERMAHGTRFVRPLLGLSRATLRAHLVANGLAWAEDPSNDDPRFQRVRARAALAALAPLGIDAAGLVATAARMARAQAALVAAARALAAQALRIEAGDVLIARAALAAAPRETAERVLAQALCWVASADYRPRRAALSASLDAALAGRAGTLHGCLLRPAGALLRIAREPAAVAGLRVPVGVPWDGRWHLSGPAASDPAPDPASDPAPDPAPGAMLEIRALGPAGLAACPGWRAAGLPRESLLASPAVWHGARLVAAPLVPAHAAQWRAWPVPGADALFTMTLSH